MSEQLFFQSAQRQENGMNKVQIDNIRQILTDLWWEPQLWGSSVLDVKTKIHQLLQLCITIVFIIQIDVNSPSVLYNLFW